MSAEAIAGGDDGVRDAAGFLEVDPLVGAQGEAQGFLLCARIWWWWVHVGGSARIMKLRTHRWPLRVDRWRARIESLGRKLSGGSVQESADAMGAPRWPRPPPAPGTTTQSPTARLACLRAL